MIQKIQEMCDEHLDVFLTRRQIILGLGVCTTIVIFLLFFSHTKTTIVDDEMTEITPPSMSAPLFEKK